MFLWSTALVPAQNQSSPRIDPPFWWAGMENTQLELLVSHPGIAAYKVEINYPGVTLRQNIRWDHSDFMAIQLELATDVKPGSFQINFTDPAGTVISVSYALKKRGRDARDVKGVDASDFIYLIMPDRFSNGDVSNDIVKGTQQASINRDSMFHRHGGDLQGILNHLDYLEQLGITALWLNPVQENDQPKESYHGYAITDHYRIDPRFGDNEMYKRLANSAKAKGMKMVMDVVYNHWGDQHYLYRNGLPSEAWVHRHDGFFKTSYRAPTLMDPHASTYDKQKFTNGWFDHHMPDLDQTNPHLASYLIQNTIWWVEYAGLDGLRIDTYAYADQDFMGDLVRAVLTEYPGLGIFGETWVHGNTVQSWFTDNQVNEGHDSPLPGVTDFQLYYSINDALTKDMGWTDGISRMYYTLAKDFLYKDPLKNCLFLDNHDLSRFYSVVNEDFAKYKMGIAWLLTMRGIPQIYYGTEILMKNYADPDGKVREDFPGGWPKDPINKFKSYGRNETENSAFNYVKTLAAYRKSNPVLQNGSLTQFVPENGVYVYFRHNREKTIMVVMNCSKEPKNVKTDRFVEFLGGKSRIKNVVSGKSSPIEAEMNIKAWTTQVLEVQ